MFLFGGTEISWPRLVSLVAQPALKCSLCDRSALQSNLGDVPYEALRLIVALGASDALFPFSVAHGAPNMLSNLRNGDQNRDGMDALRWVASFFL